MRLLDLFCGAGGASMGYHRAGFEVVGVDKEAHPDYPFEFHHRDALSALVDASFLATFDAIAASPPCPRYSVATKNDRRSNHSDLIPLVRRVLRRIGKPYVIENVVGAPLESPLLLCGSMFDLQVRRHRLFESNVALRQPQCDHRKQKTVIGVYGQRMGTGNGIRPDGMFHGRAARDLHEGQVAMGIDWMQWKDLTDAIPPAYTEYIGSQIMVAIP